MAYRVRSDPDTRTITDPDTGESVTYSVARGPIQIADATNQKWTFQPGDIYPDWAYAIYNNPRQIETIS